MNCESDHRTFEDVRLRHTGHFLPVLRRSLDGANLEKESEIGDIDIWMW